ncbi:MAG TPA: hypothetical protein QF776_01795 [Acidimicrobiales bacterium]|jgi:hypothetical protein|nr:hypothetical protein [Acidimicrobiales bacterium]HJM29421.1 hypothetical protein [Acidimicrobiales bacterium]HJM96887.1 hypothetical protein [Acidimicrobiales bacterium]
MKNSEYVEQALALIDTHLSSVQSREVLSGSEVSDLLLDIRLLLMQFESLEEPATARS